MLICLENSSLLMLSITSIFLRTHVVFMVLRYLMLFARKIQSVWRKYCLSKIQPATQRKVVTVLMNMNMKDKRNILTNKALDLCHSNNRKKVNAQQIITDLLIL